MQCLQYTVTRTVSHSDHRGGGLSPGLPRLPRSSHEDSLQKTQPVDRSLHGLVTAWQADASILHLQYGTPAQDCLWLVMDGRAMHD